MTETNCDDVYDVADIVGMMAHLEQDSFEPDDSPQQATAIASGETIHFRTVAPAGDMDWTEFTLAEPASVITHALSSYPPLDLRLVRVSGENQEVLAASTSTEAVVTANLGAGD
ncbi:hypothetical protein JXA47_01915 [Candidatus Sumerlaeota bacterium]|nr:hypothetical protein [Candidatus Sumerlaeota bacterium]